MPSPSHILHIEAAEYLARDGRRMAGERGRLVVPMRRDGPGDGRVELAFVRLPAADPARAGDPTVFLTGGPGLSAIASGRGRLFDLFRSLRSTGDVILLDQRGCGESAPSLACGDPLMIPIDRPVTREEFTTAAVAAMRRCAAEHAARGVDLAGFNTNESAADVADLASALGYSRVGLLGWSYGSHLAMALMRRHRDCLGRVVLAGPEGPDQTYKLPSRVHAQLARLSARAGFDASAAVRAALDLVERAPARVVWNADGTTAAIGRFDLEWVLAQALADTRALRHLPAVLSNMTGGDFNDLARDPVLRAMVEEFRGGLFRSPLRYCVDCASGVSAARWERIERESHAAPLGRTIDWPFPEICDVFGRPDLGGEFRSPLRSSVKALFITGTLDCRTPEENVLDLAPLFLSPRHLVVEDAGHADLLLPRAVHDAVTEFLHSGNLDVAHATADQPFAPLAPHATLVYDGDCAFCRAQVDMLRRRGAERVVFLPRQSVGDRFPDIPREDFARAVHLIGPDGSVATGARAVLTAASGRSRLARAALLGYRYVPGVAVVAEFAYRLVARNRHRIGR
ncbi:MAG TPA: alpha/beta fold hydrolase [Candidatus Krumholzibacteria bacterium]|nr:alpha/beta fold hydrolase [Candidatus Krumholzibacteria bacterium]